MGYRRLLEGCLRSLRCLLLVLAGHRHSLGRLGVLVDRLLRLRICWKHCCDRAVRRSEEKPLGGIDPSVLKTVYTDPSLWAQYLGAAMPGVQYGKTRLQPGQALSAFGQIYGAGRQQQLLGQMVPQTISLNL